MTNAWKKYWWQPGFVAAFLVIGVPYWRIPYGQLNLPDALLGAGLLAVPVAAMHAQIYSGQPFWRVTGVMGSVVPAVVVARVLFDWLRDSTSHNLWPFEVVIAAFVGGVAAIVGALLGSLFRR